MNERLRVFVNYLIVNLIIKSHADFAGRLGIARSQFSEILSGKRKVSKSLVNKIHNLFPDINTSWLLTGEGEMLSRTIIQQNNQNGDNIQGASVTINKQEGDYLEIIKNLTSQLSKSQEQMDRLITIIENKL